MRGGPAHVQRIYRLLGMEAVLLPIPLGTKKPVFDDWQNTALEQTQSPVWQRKLRQGNIGVLLGTGLITIDCDTAEFASEMLDLNSWLGGTLQTQGKRGRNYWLRMASDYPKGVKKLRDRSIPKPKEVGEWRAEGGHTICLN